MCGSEACAEARLRSRTRRMRETRTEPDITTSEVGVTGEERRMGEQHHKEVGSLTRECGGTECWRRNTNTVVLAAEHGLGGAAVVEVGCHG